MTSVLTYIVQVLFFVVYGCYIPLLNGDDAQWYMAVLTLPFVVYGNVLSIQYLWKEKK